MFSGTAICGAMPTFEWNLVMCFLMGASAGGMLPIAFTLMAETVPAAHRGWLLVALGGVGTSAGYLLAAGRSEEHTSELQSLMRSSYAVFCLKQKKSKTIDYQNSLAKT